MWQDLNLRFPTSKAGRLNQTFSHTDKLWWRPGVSNPSRHSTCKAEPQPSAAPIYWYPRQVTLLRLRVISTVLYFLTKGAINTIMKTYKNFTPCGLNFHLSLIDGVCCMIVYDRFFCEYHMQYFTNINKALGFINNLWLVVIVGLEPTIDCVWSNCISHYAILPYRNTLLIIFMYTITWQVALCLSLPCN